jgi:hypothetical protein
MFGYSPEYVLSMPAIRFFSMMRSARKIEVMKHAREHTALCDIASISLGDAKYYEETRKVFQYRATGKEDKLNPSRALDPTAPETLMAVNAIFEIAQRTQ